MTMAGRVLAGTLSQRVALAAALWVAASLVLVVATFWLQASHLGGLATFHPLFMVPALAFAAASFLLRTLRWHIFLRSAGAFPPFLTSFRTQLVGFSLTMTPGKVGELYKCYLMEQRTGVPAARTAPIVLFEKLMDAAAFAGLALLSAMLLSSFGDSVSAAARTLLFVVGAGVAIVVLARWVSVERLGRLLLPLARRSGRGAKLASAAEVALAGGADVLTPSVVSRNLALSFVARTCDGLAVTWTAWALGIQIPILGGIFALNSAGTLGGLSMLPGGIGVVEASMSVILASFGASPAAALAGTMLARFLTFWLWVAMGLFLLVQEGLVEGREAAR
jgi:glycosyltransferase 2 family protein